MYVENGQWDKCVQTAANMVSLLQRQKSKFYFRTFAVFNEFFFRSIEQPKGSTQIHCALRNAFDQGGKLERSDGLVRDSWHTSQSAEL